MSYSSRLVAFVVVAAALHLVLARALASLLPLASREAQRPALVRVQLSPPPPASAPEPEPDPAPPHKLLERPARHAPARRIERVTTATRAEPRNEETPPTERPAATGEATQTPVFGLSMESTSQGGAGPGMPVGNTLQIKPGRVAPGGSVKPLRAPPAPLDEVTKMPLPQGRCAGKYTDDAREAGVEGTVVLDLVVGEDGRAREILVVQGLDHGLTEAAVAALKGCWFSPGERNGRPVAVRLRGFKIRFVLQGAD